MRCETLVDREKDVGKVRFVKLERTFLVPCSDILAKAATVLAFLRLEHGGSTNTKARRIAFLGLTRKHRLVLEPFCSIQYSFHNFDWRFGYKGRFERRSLFLKRSHCFEIVER